MLCVKRRVLGEEHPDTLATANNLVMSLSYQGKHAEAKQIHSEVLGVKAAYSAMSIPSHC